MRGIGEAHLILFLRTQVLYIREEIYMICDTLKKLRNIYGFKASEMSTKLGISSSYLSEIENGKKQPSLELLNKYSEIFDIKLSSLILISETYEEAEAKGKATVMIRNMMMHLINGMSQDGDVNETEKVST